MKRVLTLCAAVVVLAGVTSAGPHGYFPVSPQGSFLLQSPNDVCSEYNIPGCNMNPTFINLSGLGVQAGETISITPVGGLCVYPGPGCTVYPADLGGVFSSSNTLLGPSFQNRLPGAIPPGAGATLVGNNLFLFTFAGNLDTTIGQDFYIPVNVVVPTGANWLVVGVLDSAYSDNSSSLLGVNLSNLGIVSGTGGAAVPEPHT